MDFIIGIIAFIFVLGVIILIHEGGHFMFARRVNILCREFAFGMGPILLSKKKGETLYSLRAFPIGGFCAIAGEEVEDDPLKDLKEVRLEINDGVVTGFYLGEYKKEVTAKEIVNYDIFDENDTGNLFITVLEDGKEVTYPVDPQAKLYFSPKNEIQIAPHNRTLNAKRKRDRALVMFGGPLMNFVLALVVFFIAGLIQGYPNYKTSVIDDVTQGTPVYEAGLRDGDKIIKLESGSLVLDINEWDDITVFMNDYAETTTGLAIKVTYLRDGEENEVLLSPYTTVYNSGFGNDYSLIGLISFYGNISDGAKILKLQAGTYAITVSQEGENSPYYGWSHDSGLTLYDNNNNVIVNYNKITEFCSYYLENNLQEDIVVTYQLNNETKSTTIKGSDLFYQRNGKYTSFKFVVSALTEYSDNMANNSELKVGDVILKIDNVTVEGFDDIYKAFKNYVGENKEKIKLEVYREVNGTKSVVEVNVKPYAKAVMDTQTTNAGEVIPPIKVAMGVSPTYKFSLLKSFAYSGKRTIGSFTAIFDTFKLLFSGNASIKNLSGPVGIFSLTKSIASQGFAQLLNLMGLLSVNIGLLNLLPIPALDGGRLVFLGYEAITKKKPNQKVETALITITMLLLFGLMIFVTFEDILRLFGI